MVETGILSLGVNKGGNNLLYFGELQYYMGYLRCHGFFTTLTSYDIYDDNAYPEKCGIFTFCINHTKLIQNGY